MTFTMFPPEIICEIMSHLSYTHIKQMCQVNKMFNQASKHQQIRQIILLGKIHETESYTFYCNHQILQKNANACVDKIFGCTPISETDLKRDLNFIFGVSRDSNDVSGARSVYGETLTLNNVPSFETSLNTANNLKIPTFNRKVFDSFLELCSNVYSRALDTNTILIQISVLMLLKDVLKAVGFTIHERFFMSLRTIL